MSVEERARAAIDAAHEADPERSEGRAAEAAYADRIESWIRKLVPEPSLELQLAARAQHLERWAIPRSTYPEGRASYLRWRTAVQARQGERVREILREAGAEEPVAERVARLVAKRVPRADHESQALEDAACLVFAQTQLGEISRRYDRDKTIDILRKTWRKLSPRGRKAMAELKLGSGLEELLREAAGSS